MTFYNIIFGILFLGACQALLLSLNAGTDTRLIALVALILLSENTQNFLDAPVHSTLPGFMKHPSTPPILLLVYCGLVASWNWTSTDIRQPGEWPWYLITAVGAVVIALIVLVALRPVRVEYSTAYTLVTGIAMLGTLGYLVSYSFIKPKE